MSNFVYVNQKFVSCKHYFLFSLFDEIKNSTSQIIKSNSLARTTSCTNEQLQLCIASESYSSHPPAVQSSSTSDGFQFDYPQYNEGDSLPLTPSSDDLIVNQLPPGFSVGRYIGCISKPTNQPTKEHNNKSLSFQRDPIKLLLTHSVRSMMCLSTLSNMC